MKAMPPRRLFPGIADLVPWMVTPMNACWGKPTKMISFGVPRRELGSTMIEVLLSLALLAMVVCGLMTGLSSTSISSGVVQVQATADSLARSQMEYVRSLPYQVAPATYPTLTPPSGYAVTAQALPVAGTDDQIQEVAVTVTSGGKSVLILEGMKMNR
jgi:Tfp pilus assembly protein PilV